MGEPNVKLQSRYQLFIGGEWRDASDGGVFQTTCPANGQVWRSALRRPERTWTWR